MKKLLKIILLLIVICVPLSAETEKEKLAKRAIELSGMEESFNFVKEMFNDEKSLGGQSMTEKERKIMNNELSMMMDYLRKDMVKIYTENYTEKELKDIIKFYESPTGKSLIKKMPAMQKQIYEDLVNNYIPGMTERIKKEIENEEN